MSTVDLDAANAHYAAYRQAHDHEHAFECCTAHTAADDVPALLAEVERLREENEGLSATLGQILYGHRGGIRFIFIASDAVS